MDTYQKHLDSQPDESRWDGFDSGDSGRDSEPGFLTFAQAGAQAKAMEPVIRYDGLYEYAHQHALDYNDLCRVVRAAITAPPQRKPSAGSASKGRPHR